MNPQYVVGAAVGADTGADEFPALTVVKRDGRLVAFDEVKIQLALRRAGEETRAYDETGARRLAADVTATLLARASGETAPLLFTSFNNRFFTTDITQPISTLTVQVFTYAISPYEDWIRQAWAGALVLVTIVFLCSVLARVATARMERMQRGS